MEIVLFMCADPFLAQANNIACPPPIEEMALLINNYWFFGPDGEPVAWGGQADGDPSVYANMYPTSPAHEWVVSGCIRAWTKTWGGEDSDSYTTAVSFFWNGDWRELACYDAFGNENYREPFYHDECACWVVPVDILTPEPVHEFISDWQTAVVAIGEVDG